MSRITSALALALLLHAAAASTVIRGQATGVSTYFIEGTVVDQSGSPIKHARLVLGTYTYDRQGATFSNDEGKFIFERLTEGNYKLDVSAAGCVSHQESISLFSTPRNLRIVLAPASKAEPFPEANSAVVSAATLITPAKAREEYEKAILAEKSRKMKAARKHLDKALRLYPQYAAAYAPPEGFFFWTSRKLPGLSWISRRRWKSTRTCPMHCWEQGVSGTGKAALRTPRTCSSKHGQPTRMPGR